MTSSNGLTYMYLVSSKERGKRRTGINVRKNFQVGFFFLLVSSLTLFIYLFLKLIALQYHTVPKSERLLLLT